MKFRLDAERRDLILDWVFLVGVALKGIDGLIEVLAGIPLFFITKWQLMSLAQAVTAGELAEDPHDLLANFLLHEASKASGSSLFIGGLYLFLHGVVKLAIVIALVRGSRRVYPWAVGALSVLLVIQLVDLVVKFSVGVLLLTLLDALIIWLTVREWRHGRTLHDVLRLRAPWFGRRDAERSVGS
ncbi:DUF2127 domain-containing protein [Humibacter soli]